MSIAKDQLQADYLRSIEATGNKPAIEIGRLSAEAAIQKLPENISTPDGLCVWLAANAIADATGVPRPSSLRHARTILLTQLPAPIGPSGPENSRMVIRWEVSR